MTAAEEGQKRKTTHMKKLMVAAFAVAAGVAMGATPTAQVYDVTLKIKSTAAASATVNNKQNPLACTAEDGKVGIVYRKQASYTWKGLVWGCGCETINGKWEIVQNDCDDVEVVQGKTIKGCILWDTKTKQPVYVGDGSDLTDAGSVPGCGFGWKLLHAINKDGKQVEGTFSMSQYGNACDENDMLFEFAGAGFGSACLDVEDGEPTCLSYVKSISGNFAGWMKAPNKTTTTAWTGCTYCGLKGGEMTCDFAEGWQWCDWSHTCNCDTGIEPNLDATAAYGTWTVKYNSGLSKKLAQPVKVSSKGVSGVVVSIRDVYNFSSLPAVEAAIEAVENKIWGVRTVCDDLGDDVDEAEAEVYAAETNKAYVTTANLAKVRDEAKSAWEAANAERNAAKLAETASNVTAVAAAKAYGDQMLFVTNNSWTVAYKNSSQDTVTADGRGLESFDETAEELKTFTIVSLWYDGASADGYITPATYASAKAFVGEQEEKTLTLKAALDGAVAGAEYAKADLAEKQDIADELASEYSAANRAYDNRASLQALAARRLTEAEDDLEEANEAYEEAGCK